MKKIIKSAIPLLLLVLSLASCSLFGGDTSGGVTPPDNGGGQQNPTDNTKLYTSLVYTDDGIDLSEIRVEMMDIIGQGVTVNHISTAPTSESEVIFGDCDRAVTVAAKAALSAELDKSTKYDTGYIIYSDGKSVAVYWMHPDMKSIAVADFLNTCVKKDKLVLANGIVLCEVFNEREFEVDKYWLAIEAVADPEVVAALRTLNAYFDGAAIVDFYANLWDGAIDGNDSLGGFYYTVSARDNVPYLPDLESTKQILEGLENNGAIDDVNSAFPTEIKVKLLNFAKSTQSAKDGYFYHPQWPKDKSQLQTDRYGRDMGHATNIIKKFTIDTDGDGIEEKQYPNYCAPNGNKCALHTGTDEKCSFPIATAYYASLIGSSTTSLTVSHSDAVAGLSSYVSAVATVSSHPDYSSRAKFSEWLEAYNATIKENSGKAHNLSAIRDEITQHGYDDIVLDYLDRIQAEVFEEQIKAGETPTGLWQKNVDYNAVWGLLKYMGYYNAGKTHGRAIDEKYLPYIIETCVKVIELPADGNYASNDLFNQWDSIDRVFENARTYYGEEKVEQLREILRRNAASLVNNSLEKIDDLAIGNGTFALKSNGTSPSKMYGVPISPGIAEGNVNSTNIICSMYNSVFTALGYNYVPLFASSDGARFVETIITLPPIDKEPVGTSTLDFEDGELPISISTGFNNSATSVTVVDDIYGDDDKAILLDSPKGENGDTLYFQTGSSGTGCYIFESSICVSSETVTTKADENIVQIKLGDNKKAISYLIILQRSSSGISVIEATNTSDKATYTTIASAEMDKYFKLRIEYYVGDPDYDPTPMIKVWVDDELKHISSAYYGSHTDGTAPADTYSYASFYCLKAPAIKLYLDDCFFNIEDKIYTDDDDISDSRG